jgi:hypothetical protein
LRDQLGVDALVDLGPPRDCSPAGGASSPGVPLPHGLQRVADVTADSRLMVDGLLLRGESQTSPRTQGAMQVAAAAQAGAPAAGPGMPDASGGREAPQPRSYPQLVPAHDLARALRDSGHCAWLVTFNVWNSAARLAPLVVGERGALAALGFQDAFDDALAEFVHATAAGETARPRAGTCLPAFESMWREVRLTAGIGGRHRHHAVGRSRRCSTPRRSQPRRRRRLWPWSRAR